MISMIVAAAANNTIGKDGALPWHLPDDLRRFKAITMGKPIVMGRRTHESIGRPLPGRQNIVITRTPGFEAGGCDVVGSPADALAAAADAEEVVVIGGGEIYRQFLPWTERIYMTRVEAQVDGDAFFPDLDPGDWRVADSEEFPAEGVRQYAYVFQVLDRTTKPCRSPVRTGSKG